MKNRQTGEKRRKEMRRMEKQRDKEDRRKLRRQERTVGGGPDTEEAPIEGAALGDGELPSASLGVLASAATYPGSEAGHALGAGPGSGKPLP